LNYIIDYSWTPNPTDIIGTRKTANIILVGDIRVESLNDDQMRDLNRLKVWLYQKRTTVGLERERAERRQKKEEETAKRKEAQPALFDF